MKKITSYLYYAILPCTLVASTTFALNVNAKNNEIKTKVEKHYDVMHKQLSIMSKIISQQSLMIKLKGIQKSQELILPT